MFQNIFIFKNKILNYLIYSILNLHKFKLFEEIYCLKLPKIQIFINDLFQEKENKMGLQALGLLLQTILEMSRKMVCFSAHAIRPFDGIPVQGVSFY